MAYTISYSIPAGAAITVSAITPEEAIVKARRFAAQGHVVEICDHEGGRFTLDFFENLISEYRRRERDA